MDATTNLARLARSLNAGRACPALVLMTDDARLPDPCAAASRLPRGSLIVLRSRDPSRRSALGRQLTLIARRRGLWLVVSEDPCLAVQLAADGVHFPERRGGEIAHWRARRPFWFITASAHSLAAAARALHFGADAVFLSPVFPTASHPERRAFGPMRIRMIAQQLRGNIYALGGIRAREASRLTNANLAGIAAIGALSGLRDAKASAAATS